MSTDKNDLKARREAAARFGMAAGQVLNNEAYTAACLKVKTELFNALIGTALEDAKRREHLHSILVAHTRLEALLNKWFADGKIAAEDIVRLTKEAR